MTKQVRNLEKELHRLYTFRNWPGKSIVSPFTLARCGFSYSGKDDEVICFACKTHISGWSTNGSPRKRHKQCAPHCPFVKGSASRNVPLKIIHPEGNYATNSTTRPTDNAELDVDRVNPALDSWTKLYQIVLDRARKKGLLDTDLQLDRPLPDVLPDFDKLPKEEERRHTFINWPSTPNADPEGLVHAGFLDTKSGDRVPCAFCRGIVQKCEAIDLLEVEHKKHCPNCLFDRGVDAGNGPVPKDSDDDDDDTRTENGNESQTENGFAPLVTHQPISKPTSAQLPTGSYKVGPRGNKGFTGRPDPTIRSNVEMEHYQPQHEAVIKERFKIKGDDFPDVISLLGELPQLEKAVEYTKADASGFSQNSSTSELGGKVRCDICGSIMEDIEPQHDTQEECKKWCPRCWIFQ